MPAALEAVTACSLFDVLPDKARASLAQDLHERRFAEGDTITSPEIGGIAFFLLAEGTVTVSAGGTEVARLGPGDTFGEIGLLTGANRTAVIVAGSDVQCWTLSQWLFKPLVLEHPELAWRLLERLAQRVVDARS